MPESLSAPAEQELERHRRELTGYCRALLGSPSEAEDAVQEALVRAWRGLPRLECRATLRAWLYRIATNVCRDMLKARARRPAPVDLGPSPEAPEAAGADPAEAALGREALRAALVAALQRLSARERAALILCEVLRLRAAEVAGLLGTSVAAVTSALQRARARLGAGAPGAGAPAALDACQRELLARYLTAFERDDVQGLAALVREDASRPALARAPWLSATQVGPDGAAVSCRAR